MWIECVYGECKKSCVCRKMDMEFYNLYNTLSSYKRSIIRDLDKIEEGILAAVKGFENSSALKSSAKKYSLSVEMMKVLQTYGKILFLTEATAEEFLNKQTDRDCDRNSDSRNSSNPFSSFRITASEHPSLDTEVVLNYRAFKLDELPSKLPSNIISDTETLVDLTNKLIESEFGSSASDSSRTLVPEGESSEDVDDTRSLPSEIKVEPSALNNQPVEENLSRKFFDNLLPKAPTCSQNDECLMPQNSFSKTATKCSPSENGYSRIPVRSPSEVADKIFINLSCKTMSPVKKDSPKLSAKSPSPRSKIDNHSVRRVVMNENPVNPPKPQSTSKVTVRLPKSSSPPKTMKSPLPEPATPTSEKVKSPKPEDAVPEQPQIDVEANSTEIKPPPEPPVVVKTPETPNPGPRISVETPESPISVNTSEPPVVLKTSEPSISVKTLELINASNVIIAPEVSHPAENRKTSPPSTANHEYTALAKLLSMNVHDRRKEAEKRYEGKHVTKNFQWKTVTKSPSSGDKKTKEKCAILFELSDDVLLVNQLCNFCYIVNPQEFYVRTNQELFESLENSLNEDLNSVYQYVVSNYQSKQEARAFLGNFCFVFLTEHHRWYRVQVLDWLENEPERILVQLVDHGEVCYCWYKNLKPMMKLYAEFPKMAIRCHFAHIRPPGPSGEFWKQGSIDALVELSEMVYGSKFLVIYVHKEGQSYAVDLQKEDGDKTLAQVLVECDLAAEDLELEDEEDSLDFDNINEAVAGYDAKDEARICPFTDDSGRCFKGPACKLEHGKLSADGITTDKVLSVNRPLESLVLPAAGDNIEILVTGFINTCHFYAQIVTNRTSPDQVSNYNDFKRLRENMNARNLVQTYEPLKIYPGIGELVLVDYLGEWQRAVCRGYSGNYIELFLVDFGVQCSATMSQIRQMKDEFLYLPVQAVECMLDSCCERRDVDVQTRLDFYNECMYLHTFKAFVVEVNEELLRLKMWDGNGTEMGYVLKQYGLVNDRQNCLFPEKNSLLSCA